LDVDPTSTTALFMKARVLWCGSDDPEGAEGILARLLNDASLGEDSRSLVESDLDAIRNGEPCS
jgi:hypothetical protein